MKQWFDPTPIDIPDDLKNAIGGHPLIAESLVRRGFTSVEQAQQFLNPAQYIPTSSDDLPDIDKAVDRLRRAIANKEQILVWGDFDVDGQTSTALLVSALRGLGATVAYHIPDRFTEGHGVHLPTLKTYLDEGVELVLTCDTGISAHDAIDYANSRGVDVVITDHHTLSPTLPNAYAVVNPMRLTDGHPLRELPGVGTAYKVVEALYGSQSTEHLLDLVAMGIVADVMVQVDDTRYLLQQGLEVLRHEPRAGLKALMERAKIDPQYLTEMDIGFSLAPRLNAVGRLANANAAVELLTATDDAIINERVTELEGLNQKRRFLTRQVYGAAQQQIKEDPSLLKYAALVVAGQGWHTGVVGIVASRLAEDYGSPVIVLSEQEGRLSGSARSVTGANIIEAIRTQSGLLNSFGGHNMAAGLSMPSDNLFEFRRGLSQVVRNMLGKSEIVPQLSIDGYLSFAEINLALAEDISRLAPFGNGNPPLTLATTSVQVKKRRTMGSRGDHLDLTLVDENENEQRVVWWFGDADAIPDGQFDIAYTLRENVFNGKREALVEWVDVRQSAKQAVTVQQPSYEIIDYRQHPNPLAALNEIQQQYPDALVFVEGDKRVSGYSRYALQSCETLIVWTMPPSQPIWNAILDITNPQRLVLFNNYPKFKSSKALLEYVAGMAKYAFNHRDGLISMDDMTNATALPSQIIQLSIESINQSQSLQFTPVKEDTYSIKLDAEKTGTTRISDDNISQISMLLKEVHAYRLYLTS